MASTCFHKTQKECFQTFCVWFFFLLLVVLELAYMCCALCINGYKAWTIRKLYFRELNVLSGKRFCEVCFCELMNRICFYQVHVHCKGKFMPAHMQKLRKLLFIVNFSVQLLGNDRTNFANVGIDICAVE